jgi:hypothetical protein
MSKLREVRVAGGTVHVLPVVKGLLSETEKVREAFDSVRPGKVAVSLSKEEVEGLRHIPDDYEPELSRYDEIFVEGLKRYGEVAAPPPCYVAIVELADHFGVTLIPIDLDEDSYSELYCAAVTGPQLFRHSTRTWLLKRRRFEEDTAEEYVLRWDRAVNNMQGMRLIEEKRSEAMANGLKDIVKDGNSVLAVIELERAGDVVTLLEERPSVTE